MFGKIGKVLSNVTKAAGSVSKFASGVTKVAGQALSFLQKPMNQVLGPISKFVGEKVGKIPFFGKHLSPIATALVRNAGSFLSAGSLGGIGFLARLAPKLQNLTQVAQTVSTVAQKVGAFQSKPSRVNFQHIIAQAHASIVAQNHVRSLVAK